MIIGVCFLRKHIPKHPQNSLAHMQGQCACASQRPGVQVLIAGFPGVASHGPVPLLLHADSEILCRCVCVQYFFFFLKLYNNIPIHGRGSLPPHAPTRTDPVRERTGGSLGRWLPLSEGMGRRPRPGRNEQNNSALLPPGLS